MHLVNISQRIVRQSHRMKIQIKLLTPKDRLSPEPTSSPLKKKPRTHKQIMVMEGGNEDMEVDFTT
jgi:hypothetical protein